MSPDREKLFELPKLDLNSKVANLVVGLEPLRTKYLPAEATTPPWLFFELKNLFQAIESVTSAQIEGNKTTVAEFVEAARAGDASTITEEKIKMIANVENGIRFIEGQDISNLKIDKEFIWALHRIVVDGLSPRSEGDVRAGAYTNKPRSITHSKHVLPHPADVTDLMDGLIAFVNLEVPHQMDLIKIAQAHHRFVWIHPFTNGNGRVVRLVTYAMLARSGYIDKDGARLLDPAAVFGTNKFVYYDMLAKADDLSEKGLEAWCEYMLGGLDAEVAKIDRLLNENFAKKKIIVPAIEYAHSRERITTLERNMLLVCVENDIVSVSDFRHLFPKNISRVNISHALRKLRDRRLIEPIGVNSRKYNLVIARNNITFAILKKLDENGFLPPLPDGA